MNLKLWPAQNAREVRCVRGNQKIYREQAVPTGTNVIEYTPLSNSTIELVDNGEVVGILELQHNIPKQAQLKPCDPYPARKALGPKITKSKPEDSDEDSDEPDEDDMEDDAEQDAEEQLEESTPVDSEIKLRGEAANSVVVDEHGPEMKAKDESAKEDDSDPDSRSEENVD